MWKTQQAVFCIYWGTTEIFVIKFYTTLSPFCTMHCFDFVWSVYGLEPQINDCFLLMPGGGGWGGWGGWWVESSLKKTLSAK